MRADAVPGTPTRPASIKQGCHDAAASTEPEDIGPEPSSQPGLNLQAEACLIVTQQAPVVEGRHGVQVPDLGPCLLGWPPLLPHLQALNVLLHIRSIILVSVTGSRKTQGTDVVVLQPTCRVSAKAVSSAMPGSVSWLGPGPVRAL